MNYNNYLESLNPSNEVLEWTKTTLEARLRKPYPPALGDVEHVLDYLCSDRGPKKLRRMSWPQASLKTAAWVKTLKKKGENIKEKPEDVKVIHEFSTGARIVQLLHKRAYQREGFLMSHCVSSYSDKNIKVYSYRDSKNRPHATFEVSEDGGEIVQVKGKGNGAIHPKYIEPILAFLKSIDVPVRRSEMKLLGYTEVDDDSLNFLKTNFKYDAKIVNLLGSKYVVNA